MAAAQTAAVAGHTSSGRQPVAINSDNPSDATIRQMKSTAM